LAFLLLWLVSYQTLVAQQQNQNDLAFRIVDSLHKSIPNVVVIINYKGRTDKLIDNRTGVFHLSPKDTAGILSLRLSQTGYRTKFILRKELSSYQVAGTSGVFEIPLMRKEIILEEVDVKARLPFYQQRNVTILDFEMTSNGDFIFVMEKLIYLINAADSLVKKVPNLHKVDRIVKTCAHNFYVFNADSVYACFVSKSELLVSENAIDSRTVLRQIDELVACNAQIKIKKRVGAHRQEIYFSAQSKEDSGAELLLYKAEHAEALRVARLEQKEIESSITPNRMGELTEADLKVIKVYDRLVWKYEALSTKELYAPAFIKGDSLVIFDYGTKCLKVFQYEKKMRSLHFTTLKTDTVFLRDYSPMPPFILQDRSTKELFVIKKIKPLQMEYITEDFQRRPIIQKVPEGTAFPSAMKLQNHTLCFLARSAEGNYANQKLMKIRLDW